MGSSLRSGSRVSVELIVSESDCQETINSLLMKALHPISTLTPQLPTVSMCVCVYVHAHVCVYFVLSVMYMPPNLVKTFTNTHKIVKFTKSFSPLKVSRYTVYTA